MPKITLYNFKSGEKKGQKELPDDVFGLPMNESLLHQVYSIMAGNRRAAIAHTKDRSERAGSGKKPWKQKGTGNARVGSVRSPLWRKGGIVFGPTKDRNFKKNCNRKMKQKAILIALSEKVKNNMLFLVDAISLDEKKTKHFAAALKKIGIARSVIVALGNEEKEMSRYARNIEGAKSMLVGNLNAYDLLNYQNVILSEESLKWLKEKNATDDEPKEVKK